MFTDWVLELPSLSLTVTVILKIVMTDTFGATHEVESVPLDVSVPPSAVQTYVATFVVSATVTWSVEAAPGVTLGGVAVSLVITGPPPLAPSCTTITSWAVWTSPPVPSVVTVKVACWVEVIVLGARHWTLNPWLETNPPMSDVQLTLATAVLSATVTVAVRFLRDRRRQRWRRRR